MKAVADYPVKRPPRPTGRDTKRTNPFRFALRLAIGTRLDELAIDLPHLDPSGNHYDEAGNKRPGCKPEFPPEVYLLYVAMMGYLKLSDRDVEAILRDKHEWGPIRRAFAERFPQYKGLTNQLIGPTRSQFHYWQRQMRKTSLLAYVVVDRHIDQACAQAEAMGMFQEARTSLSEPHIADMLIGDGTNARARYSASPGDRQFNQLTGELEQIRHDPDATRQIRKSDDDVATTDTAGTNYGVIHATTGFPNENVMLAAFHVPSEKGSSEARVALRYLALLADRLPGATGAMWDKAMHGKEIDAAYQLGLMLNAKVSQSPGGGPKEQLIELAKVRVDGEVIGELALVGVGGAAHVRIQVGRAMEYVRLEPIKIIKRPNRGERNGRRWRWFGEYRVPEDPRIPRKFRGGTIRVRLDTTEDDRRRRINRAENLRPIAQGDELWKVVGGPRSRAEALFSQTKHKWPNKRIQAVGIHNQMLRLLGFGIGLNAEATRHYENRTGHSLDPPMPDLVAA